MKRKICITLSAFLAILLAVYEFFLSDRLFTSLDATDKRLVNMTLTRMIGGAIFLIIVLYLGYKILNPAKKPFLRSLLFSLPAFIVVVNNLPIIPLLTGGARVTGTAQQILLLACECLAIGFFEEFAFRGVVLAGIMEKRRGSTRNLFISIVLSSAVFGAIHLLNLFLGASPGAVFLQIGYSFLIGAMCSVVLIRTANIWLCVLLHAIYDFCGAIVPTYGEGTIWDAPTVTITAVIAVAVTIFYIIAFVRTDASVVDRVYDEVKGNSEK